MKTLIIYQSKYGSTKQYAEWIKESLSSDLMHVNDVDSQKLYSYDIIIFGSYLHIGKIVDIDFIIKNWDVLKSKKVVLFSVSGAPSGSFALNEAYEKALPLEIRKDLAYFQFQGKSGKLDLKDNLLLLLPKTAFVIKSMFNKNIRNPYASFDKVDRTKTYPLVEFVKKMSS